MRQLRFVLMLCSPYRYEPKCRRRDVHMEALPQLLDTLRVTQRPPDVSPRRAEAGDSSRPFRSERPEEAKPRGGIGMFRNDVQATLIAPALLASGQSGLRQITCIGSAIPLPDWNTFVANEASIPTQCADTSSTTPFAVKGSNVFLIDRSFAAQRSRRANLALNAFIVPKLVRGTVEGIYSLNLDQQGLRDLKNRAAFFDEFKGPQDSVDGPFSKPRSALLDSPNGRRVNRRFDRQLFE